MASSSVQVSHRVGIAYIVPRHLDVVGLFTRRPVTKAFPGIFTSYNRTQYLKPEGVFPSLIYVWHLVELGLNSSVCFYFEHVWRPVLGFTLG